MIVAAKPRGIPFDVPRLDMGIFGIAHANMPMAVRLLAQAIERPGRRYFCFCEANLLASAIRDRAVARVLDRADVVFADGVALVLLAQALGHARPSRVPGPSFMLAACEYGVDKGWRHFFYGGAQGIGEKLAAGLTARFPGIAIAGTHCPPFRPLTGREEAAVKSKIEQSGADIVWVALGSPKQELWCARHVGKIDVPVLLPVGAAFDFHTQTRPWAPVWIRKIGMEWLFRTLTGGRRTFVRNVRCVSTVALHIAGAAIPRATRRLTITRRDLPIV